MTETQEALLGDNRPPEAEALFDEISSRTSLLVENANLWVTDRGEITTEEEAVAAADYLDQLRALGTDKTGRIDKARLAEQQPFTDRLAEIRDRWKPVKRSIELCVIVIKGMLTPWHEKQDAIKDAAHRAAEQVARKAEQDALDAAAVAARGDGDVVGNRLKAEEAEDRAAKAGRDENRAAAGYKTGSNYGGRSKSLRSRTVVKIDDPSKIPVKYLRLLCGHAYVIEALERAVRSTPKRYEGVDGITIKTERTVS